MPSTLCPPVLRHFCAVAAVFAALLAAGCANNAKLTEAPHGQPQPPPLTTASITPLTRTDLASLPPASTTEGALPLTGSATTSKPLKIGLLLPLGGFDQTAAVAKGMKQAAEMALFEAEWPGVQLIVKDDKGTPEGAKAATEEAIREGAEIILGPLFGRAVAGVAPVAQASNVPVLTFSNDRTVAGHGVYTMGFLPSGEVDRIVGFAASQGKRRLAALVPDDSYGQVVGAAFRDAVVRSGGTVAVLESYPAGANAMLMPSRRIVEAIKASEAAGSQIDAVFVPGGQDVLPQLGPLMAYSGFDAGKVKLLGSGAWEFAAIGNNGTFVGGWYPAPDPQGWRAFNGRFIKAFGTPPPRLASVAFDAVNIAMNLSATSGASAPFTAANFTRPGGFSGVDGLIRFRTDGLSERALAVLEVQKIGSTVVEAAPASLDGAKLTAAAPPSPVSATATAAPPRVN